MVNQPQKSLTRVFSVATGKMFVNGLSSSYEESYSSELQSVLSREEHMDIISRLNMTLSTYWPCGFVYATGYIFAPCTLGLSLLCPMMCVSEAETHATKLLDNLSLKAKYFERNVSFGIEKGCMTSRFVISFPEEENCSIVGRNLPDEEWGDSTPLIGIGRKDAQSIDRTFSSIQIEPGGCQDSTRLKYI